MGKGSVLPSQVILGNGASTTCASLFQLAPHPGALPSPRPISLLRAVLEKCHQTLELSECIRMILEGAKYVSAFRRKLYKIDMLCTLSEWWQKHNSLAPIALSLSHPTCQFPVNFLTIFQ